MKRRALFAFILVACMFVSTSAWSAPASPFPVISEQPDGSPVEVFRRGDEFVNWVETPEGYPLVKNTATGFWEYAYVSGNTLTASGTVYRSNDFPPAGVVRGYKPSQSFVQQQRLAAFGGSAPDRGTWNPIPVSGTRKILAIRVGFVDRALATAANDTANAFFGATNSVKKYYADQSRGSLQIISAWGGSGVVEVTLDAGDFNNGNHPGVLISDGNNTTAHANEVAFLESVLAKAAAQGVSFASFDTNGDGRITPDELCVYLIVAGYEESGSALTPSVWAHAWSSWTNMGAAHEVSIAGKMLSDWAMNGELYDIGVQMPFGVVAHELGHQFCKLPDLYDVAQYNEGLGHFSLMAGGSWGRVAAATPGSTPVNLDAWSRQYLGWETPQTPSSGTITLGTPFNGQYAAVRLSSSSHRSTEYFLAEVRALSGWDAGLGGLSGFSGVAGFIGGLLILHVDDTVGSGSLEQANDFNRYVAGQNQGCMAVEANGSYMASNGSPSNLARGSAYTLWYNGNPNYIGNGTFTGSSNPNSNFYNGTSSGIEIRSISAGGTTMTANLTIPAPAVPVTGLVVAPQAHSLAVGGAVTLTASITPDNASNPSVTWTSDNPSVATVTPLLASGSIAAVTRGATVRAISNGTARITVSTTDGSNLSATSTITVGGGSGSSGGGCTVGAGATIPAVLLLMVPLAMLLKRK